MRKLVISDIETHKSREINSVELANKLTVNKTVQTLQK